MDLFLAGTDCKGVMFFLEGYNRLLSYINNKKKADEFINIIKEVKSMDLYLAGDSSGFPAASPAKLIKESNVLLSYSHPKGQDSCNKVIQAQKEDEVDLFLSGTEKYGDERRQKFLNLFLVGPEKEAIMNDITNNLRSNVLFNYIDGKKATDKYKEQIKPKKLFIDSGAFSAWTKSKQIDVDEYIAWINERADYIDLYGQIDVIPGDIVKGHTQKQVEEAAAATWENYLYMRPKMKRPEGLLYTFHVGEPFDYLRQALEWKDERGDYIPYIALGGMVGKPTPVKKSFLDTCFEIIKKSSNPNVKVHAFGMTSFDILQSYPEITSADSTSWIMTGANGGVMTSVGTVCVSEQQKNRPDHYSHLAPHLLEAFQKEVCKYGFTLDELAKSRDYRIIHNARFMNERANNLQYITGPKKKPLF